MAIYHFSVKNISRSEGRSAVACAAYRAAEKLVDSRYGKVQDYTRKLGVELTQIYAPDNINTDLLSRNELWNAVEDREIRKDATLAREFEIAFPHELNQEQRKEMLNDLCKKIVQKYNVVVDAAIHAPHKNNDSDDRNYHAHILFTTRAIDLETGLFADKKYRDFNKEKGSKTVKEWRAEFAELTNHHLEKAGLSHVVVDHRSYAEQNIEKQATQHEGPAVTALRRQYEREKRKPQHEQNSKIVLPEVAQKNNEIKAFNLELEIIATQQLLARMQNEQAFENIINEAQQPNDDQTDNIFDMLNASISSFEEELLFSQLNSSIEQQRNIEKQEKEQLEAAQAMKDEHRPQDVEEKHNADIKRAEPQRQVSNDQDQKFGF